MITIEIGYSRYVMSKEDALTMMGILERVERFEQKYWSKDDREARGMPEGQDYTYHVYPSDTTFDMRIISDDLYNMAKLAGKPEK